jgi:succinoglycan biosynthesis protein ExoM
MTAPHTVSRRSSNPHAAFPIMDEAFRTPAIGPQRVAICLATHRRPDGLRNVLASLAAQHYREFLIIVVEHDNEPRSQAICEMIAETHALDIRYYLQDSGGLPHVRNRALAAVPTDVDWVAFIDDDETADPRWLFSLVSQADASEADVVLGPVLPVYHDSIETWLRKGGFFERKRFASGEHVPYGRTGNALVRRSWFDKMRFDERLVDSGGEDTELFARMIRAGATCVWSDEAEVSEFVPRERGTPEALRLRQFRYGNTLALVERLHGRSMTLRTAKGLYFLGTGALQYLATWYRGREARLRAELRVARALGGLSGVLGFVHRAYRSNV